MATEKQSHKAAGLVVEHQHLFKTWPGEDLQWLIQNMQGGFALWQEAVKNREKGIKEAELLVLEAVIPVISNEHFVASKYIRVDTSRKATLPISYLGDNLKVWFMNKSEEPVGETTLLVHRLMKGSVDKPILKRLGGDEAAETTLQEMLRFLVSAVKGKWYIFYIKDVNGILRAVGARWDGGGWGLDASSVESPCDWFAEGRVVSRKRSEP